MKVVALICIGVCIIVFLAGVLRGEPVFDMLMTGITIAIAAIPEGLAGYRYYRFGACSQQNA